MKEESRGESLMWHVWKHALHIKKKYLPRKKKSKVSLLEGMLQTRRSRSFLPPPRPRRLHCWLFSQNRALPRRPAGSQNDLQSDTSGHWSTSSLRDGFKLKLFHQINLNSPSPLPSPDPGGRGSPCPKCWTIPTPPWQLLNEICLGLQVFKQYQSVKKC